MAIEEALSLVDKTGDLPVPLHIRNAPTKLMKELGYGKKSDGDPDDLLPKKLSGRRYFE